MRLVLLGAPGSGKGTQGERITSRYGIPQIATGDILRSEMAQGTALGATAKKYVLSGALVPDDVILEMVEARLREADARNGFVLDGFPRSIPQAEGLDRILQELQVRLDRVIKLDVPKKLLLERMTARRVCANCATVYNLVTSPPKTPGTCDRCGGKLIQRDDDREETVRRRLNVYEASTAPLIDYYDAHGLLEIISGEGTVDEVEKRIEHAMA